MYVDLLYSELARCTTSISVTIACITNSLRVNNEGQKYTNNTSLDVIVLFILETIDFFWYLYVSKFIVDYGLWLRYHSNKLLYAMLKVYIVKRTFSGSDLPKLFFKGVLLGAYFCF